MPGPGGKLIVYAEIRIADSILFTTEKGLDRSDFVDTIPRWPHSAPIPFGVNIPPKFFAEL